VDKVSLTNTRDYRCAHLLAVALPSSPPTPPPQGPFTQKRLFNCEEERTGACEEEECVRERERERERERVRVRVRVTCTCLHCEGRPRGNQFHCRK
jgi:hypothetical protein